MRLRELRVRRLIVSSLLLIGIGITILFISYSLITLSLENKPIYKKELSIRKSALILMENFAKSFLELERPNVKI